MGWREFRAWLRAMNHQRQGRPSSPDSWEGAESDPFWREAEEERRKRRGW